MRALACGAAQQPQDTEELEAAGGDYNDADFAMYNTSSRGTGLSDLLAQGDAASTALGMHEGDTVLLPVTLNHSMGMGFGVAATLHSGATLVLPGGERVAAHRGEWAVWPGNGLRTHHLNPCRLARA